MRVARKKATDYQGEQQSTVETELNQINGHLVDYASQFLRDESISLSEHLTLTAVGTLPLTADIFY